MEAHVEMEGKTLTGCRQANWATVETFFVGTVSIWRPWKPFDRAFKKPDVETFSIGRPWKPFHFLPPPLGDRGNLSPRRNKKKVVTSDRKRLGRSTRRENVGSVSRFDTNWETGPTFFAKTWKQKKVVTVTQWAGFGGRSSF